MTMKTLAVAYAAAALLFACLDALWLTAMGSRFYRPIMGDMALPGVRWAPALAFYLIYPAGLVIFAIAPGESDSGLAGPFLSGAAYGFFTYATYNLTNFATLRAWTLALSLTDMAWGTGLAALVSLAVTFLLRKLGAA